MKKITLIVFLIYTASILGQDISYVLAENGLIVREKPNRKSEKVGKLLYGAKIQILSETGIKIDIVDDKNTITGQWVEIQESEGILKGFVFSGYLIGDEIFSLRQPNVDRLKKQIKTPKNEEVIYQYLSNNYKPFGEKFDTEYFEWDESSLCAFSQEFENKIKYSKFECKEAGGIIVKLELPKINRRHLMYWIEKIYTVDQMDIDKNVWKENNTKFEPKEINPGCYYSIKEKENSTLVDLYCGC